jgi:hypothetical protein
VSDFPDWQARAASEARDEQRRNPWPYPMTAEERLEFDRLGLHEFEYEKRTTDND